jgi:hypothetical protein
MKKLVCAVNWLRQRLGLADVISTAGRLAVALQR